MGLVAATVSGVCATSYFPSQVVGKVVVASYFCVIFIVFLQFQPCLDYLYLPPCLSFLLPPSHTVSPVALVVGVCAT